MARPFAQSFCLTAALSLLLIGGMYPLAAQQSAPPTSAGSQPSGGLDTSLSPECRVPGSLLYSLAPLKAVQAALDERRPLRVLALGSSGSSGAAATYALRLEGDLERLSGAEVEVEQRGLPGELTVEAIETITRIVTEVRPDLVIWRAGVNDALAKADLDDFSRALDELLNWFADQKIDVLLVEPPFSPALIEDEHFKHLIARIGQAARERGVPLVLRFEALRYLAQQSAPRGSGKAPLGAFALNDLGARCIAEHVTRTVALSLLLPPTASPGEDSRTSPGGAAAPRQPR